MKQKFFYPKFLMFCNFYPRLTFLVKSVEHFDAVFSTSDLVVWLQFRVTKKLYYFRSRKIP